MGKQFLSESLPISIMLQQESLLLSCYITLYPLAPSHMIATFYIIYFPTLKIFLAAMINTSMNTFHQSSLANATSYLILRARSEDNKVVITFPLLYFLYNSVNVNVMEHFLEYDYILFN